MTNSTLLNGEQHQKPASKAAELSAANLVITPNPNPKRVPPPNSPEIWTPNVTTDHILTVQWSEWNGWDAPEIKPYGPLSIMPTASVLHYATECFEGLKAYRGFDGKVRLFRPERNARRFLKSATRVALPAFAPDEFVKLLKKFVGLEARRWVTEPGQFIYIRPTMIATTATLGVQRPKEALMYILMVMWPPLDEPNPNLTPAPGAKPAKGMRLLASRNDSIRAWPGGFGYAKVGANYGPTLVAHSDAAERGYTQVLWLFGEECYVTEAGGSNFFVLWNDKQTGRKELVTAPLDDGIILEGITRASVLDVVRADFGHEVDVVEKKFTMYDILDAYKEGRLLEAFGSGTAFFIASCVEIHFRGEDIALPMATGAVSGEFALHVKQKLNNIMYGRLKHDWAIEIDEYTVG